MFLFQCTRSDLFIRTQDIPPDKSGQALCVADVPLFGGGAAGSLAHPVTEGEDYWLLCQTLRRYKIDANELARNIRFGQQRSRVVLIFTKLKFEKQYNS